MPMPQGMRIAQSGHSWVLGFVELSLGDAVAALVHLRRVYEVRDDVHARARATAGARRSARSADRRGRARRGRRDPRDVAGATRDAPRPRLAAGDPGPLPRARRSPHAATSTAPSRASSGRSAEHARSTDPFQHARTLLALGRTQRRAKQRGAARATLEDALARFERLGAPLWAEQTRAELARIGGRAPVARRADGGRARIAALVAEGRTNREVAAALFLTEHSVETALTRIYRKLGVRSRAELARLLSANS